MTFRLQRTASKSLVALIKCTVHVHQHLFTKRIISSSTEVCALCVVQLYKTADVLGYLLPITLSLCSYVGSYLSVILAGYPIPAVHRLPPKKSRSQKFIGKEK